MTLNEDLLVEQGATYLHQLVVDVEPGSVLRGQIKLLPSDAQPVYEWPASDLTVTEQGVQVLIPAAVSAVWVWSAGVYQVDARRPDGTVVRVVRGSVLLNPWPIFPAVSDVSAALVPPFYPPAYPQGA